MIGSRLGTYEVLSQLGEGGMGAVYRARDTRLKRDVAIKVLLPEVANDPERIARFEREAQLLAALNHPHIAAIYGVEQAGDITALVLEYIDGPTLADCIARGPIPLDEALAIAKQMAEALEAAHEQGIIHRDLKPANIKVRDDGTVKVLDFGLAKAMDGAGRTGAAQPDLTHSPTLTSPVGMSGVGMLLGTAAYMSPEQARGRAVDKRADIWAFGCVLYEMLTAKRAFAGDDITDTLATIVRDTPDLNRVPPQVRRLLGKCLEKDPSKRLRAIGSWDLLLDESAPAPMSARTAGSRAGWVAAAAFAAATAALALVHFREQALEQPPLFVSLSIPPNSNPGFLALSPDGTRVVIRASDAGEIQLLLRSLHSPDARVLTKTGAPRAPFWSPDGRMVGFFAEGKLKVIDAAGGVEQTLCELAGLPQGGSWGTDGTILFAASGALAPGRPAARAHRWRRPGPAYRRHTRPSCRMGATSSM